MYQSFDIMSMTQGGELECHVAAAVFRLKLRCRRVVRACATAEEVVKVPTPPAVPPPRRDDDGVRRAEAEPEDDGGDGSEDNSRHGPSREDRTRLDDRGHGRRRRKSRSQDQPSRRDETPRRQDGQPDPKTGYVVCGVCNMQVGGGWYGYQSHCQTSKYHQACTFYAQGLPWAQAQARASKDWAKWHGASVSRTPARQAPVLRERRSRSRRRRHRRGSEEEAPRRSRSRERRRSTAPATAKTVPVPARSKTGKQPAKEKNVDGKNAPTRRTGKEAAKKAPASQKPMPPPAKEESSQYSYVEDDEEEESESDEEVEAEVAKPKSTTTPSKPVASKAGAKSKATKVAPLAAASSKKMGEAQTRRRQKMESMAKLYEAQAAVMRSMTD